MDISRKHLAMPSISLFCYSCLLYLLTPVELFRLWFRGRKFPAYRLRWEERFGVFADLPSDRPRIWLHSVSVGETIASAPVVYRLLEDFPAYSILMTTTTPTGSEQVKRLFGDRVEHVYFPYDLPHVIRRFIRKTQPRLLVLMETELWPNCLRACHEHNVPVVLANARLSERSCQGYERVKGLIAPLLKTISCIAAQTTQDRARFVALGSADERVVVFGNVKSDLTVPETALQQGEQIRQRIGSRRPVWIAGSTHRGEEAQILQALRQVQDMYDDALLILVPRHPDRFEEVAAMCADQGFTVARRSRGEWPGVNTDVYLGDTMGELVSLYAASDLCFVGGSLVQIGGHNPLEPAAVGKPVLSGPYVQNFNDIYAEMMEAKAVEIVRSSRDLAQTVIRYLSDDRLREQVGLSALTTVEGGRGASDNLVGLISRIVRGY